MSYSLAVVDGDLALKGNNLALVWGIDKLKQDLSLWMRERFGLDRFHPVMGSTLEEYIGGVVNESTRADIYDEVMRILENYQSLQVQTLKKNPQKLSMTELLVSINSVDVRVNYDTVFVSVNVSNGGGLSTVINVSQSV